MNTVWFDEDGRLHGDNTDVHGFVANLDQEMPGWRMTTSTALVLGAGGAARAIVMGLMLCGVERVIVANRSAERADALVAGLPPPRRPSRSIACRRFCRTPISSPTRPRWAWSGSLATILLSRD